MLAEKIREIVNASGFSCAYCPSTLIDCKKCKKMKEFVQAILSAIRAELPKKNGYARGLCEQIGALLMGNDRESMQQGFKEFKSLKEIEKQRNVGFNQAISEMEERLR
jgi:hypothetical protein